MSLNLFKYIVLNKINMHSLPDAVSCGQHIIAVDEWSAAVEVAFVHEFRYPWVLVHPSGATTHNADFLIRYSTIYTQNKFFKCWTIRNNIKDRYTSSTMNRFLISFFYGTF